MMSRAYLNKVDPCWLEEYQPMYDVEIILIFYRYNYRNTRKLYLKKKKRNMNKIIEVFFF